MAPVSAFVGVITGDDGQDTRFSWPAESRSANRLAYCRQERRPHSQRRSWRGNDVGILMAPDARSFVVAAVFIANSRAGDQDRATMIADIARAVGNCFQ